MCGISGYISAQPLNGQAMLESLQHRGPDHQGSITHNLNGRQLFFGHNRLSIIDLSAHGHQPMSTDQERITIIYNGEVYNFKELRKRFLSDQVFHSNTDTEVLLYLYEKLGIDFVKELNGDFAIAILDRTNNKVFLIRDRLGVKPLYYCHQAQTLAFGSELKAIEASGLQLEHDRDQWPLFFTFKYVPGNRTMYKNVHRLPPAHYLEYDSSTHEFFLEEYWKPGYQEEYANLTFSQAQDTWKDLMSDAVQLRLIADVPVGTFLSGGLDSSIIASYLGSHPEIRHYCAVKSEEDLKQEGTTSDAHYARMLANQWGLSLDTINIGRDQASQELIQTTIHYSDDLIADGSQIPSYLITKEAAQSSRVILSGMGADELLLGYAGHMISLLAMYFDKMPGVVSRSAAKYMAQLEAGKGKFKAYKRYLYKLGRYHQYGNLRYGFLNIVGDHHSAQSIFKNPGEASQEFLSRYFSGSEAPFDAISRFERENFLVKNLHYVDRMSMANSVESRVPFLDHRLVELAANLPRKFKLSNKLEPKRLLKAAYKETIPEPIIKRRKAGFGMPLRSIFSQPEILDDLLPIDFFGQYDVFSVEQIKSLIQAHMEGREDQSALIYALISWKEWMTQKG